MQALRAAVHDVLRCASRFLLENTGDHDCIRVDPVNDASAPLTVDDPQFVTARTDAGHGARVRQRELLAAL